jgi:hypothetical protein
MASMEKGILVASDQNTEWLLPWWWENYSLHNDLPVAFVDLGMSLEKKEWCQSKGIYLTLEVGAYTVKEADPKNMLAWAKSYGPSYKGARQAWFKKPAACLLSPFTETIWLDLDCEVLRDITPLFSFLSEGGRELGAVLESVVEGVTSYNGGVLVFHKESSILQKWALLAQTDADKYWGDDRILSEVIHQQAEAFAVLPDHYNCRLSGGLPLFASIIHWNGEWGKACIAKQGGYSSMVKRALLSLRNT